MNTPEIKNRVRTPKSLAMKDKTTHRRSFITTLVGGAAAFGLSSALAPLKASALTNTLLDDKGDAKDAEKWFSKIEGKKHKMVFDMSKPNNGAALSWALTLMDTYNELGTPDSDLAVVIILRYAGGPLAIADPLWAKYGFGKRIELKDPETNEFATRNLFAKCPTEDDDCFELFQKRGGMICVCKKGLEHSAESLAEQQKLNKDEVIKEFYDNVLPGIQMVPTGIWALNRVQEMGCTFSSAG